MATFQRARSEEQRAVRRRGILRTAAAMLDEMPVAAVSLNELSRRAELAKSAVLLYFESREAVLLDLLAESTARFRDELDAAPPATVDPAAPVDVRAREVAAGLAAAFAARPVLCELLSAQAAVLERNVSVEVALRFKRAARDGSTWLGALLHRLLPELDEERSLRAAGLVVLLVGGLWTRSHPAPEVRAAFEADPDLAFLHPSFPEALASAVGTVLLGLVAEGPGAGIA